MSNRLFHSSCWLLLAALLLCAERAVVADTCGDYLQHKMEEHAGMPMAAPSPVDGESTFPLAPPPCSGPRCSQTPLSPADLPTPTAPPTLKLRQHLMLPIENAEMGAAGAYWRTSSECIYLYFAAEDIFHPPRGC